MQYKVQIASSPDFSRTVETVSTDNTSYAPPLTSYGYTSTSHLYWRVAAVDEDRNQGDWTQVQQIKMQPRLRVSVSGFARHKKMSSVRVTVRSPEGKALKGAKVKVAGLGIRAVVRKTNKRGLVVVKVRPKKKGKLLVSATKAGYQAAYGSLRVK
jgi:hypothetical protein